MNADKFRFHDDRTLRFKDLGIPTYKNFDTKNKVILGTITKDECSFDCGEYVDRFFIEQYGQITNKNYGQLKYGKHNCYELHKALDSFKSMIEAETEFLFENNLKDPQEFGVFSVVDYGTERGKKWLNHRQKWLLCQSRVIEKLLILKTI
jgi:hypothetical protein